METCRNCGIEFHWYPGKPGYKNQCKSCANDVPLTGGNMVWFHKTAPEIEIKPLDCAQRFARLQKRFGAGPLKSIVVGREPSPSRDESNPSKRGSGAGAGDGYVSKLGEKRAVKR